MSTAQSAVAATVVEPLEAWMRAVESRDARFDGWVTVGVTSTGIYCRPSCPTPVRPKRSNMSFFSTPASAQAAGFRACKRCAPDATPGSPEWNRRDDLVARAIRAIDDGVVDREGVAGLANRLAVSSRHLNRLLSTEVGATPIALARARRARSARSLIESTELSFTDIAFAAGFDSIRQFNDTVRQVFARTPTELRGGRRPRSDIGDWIELRLPFRDPLDVGHLLGWLEAHAVAGVEEVEGSTYRRSLRLNGGPAVIEVSIAADNIVGRFRLTTMSDLPQAIQRTRRLLDLDADPAVIARDLGNDPVMAAMVARRPGIRSPGDVAGIDAAVKAVLHQQVSVAAATGVAARLVAAHGDALAQPVGAITTLMPTAETWAGLDPTALGLPKSRAASLVTVAGAVAAGEIDLEPAADRDEAMQRLLACKGIGPWTASVIALKALTDPDAFCPGDLALRRVVAAAGLPDDVVGLARHAERWRPWRSYAMHHLWAAYPDVLATTAPARPTPSKGSR